HHVVEFPGGDPRRGQDVLDRADREPEVVLLAREALFLRGRDEHAVLQERGRRIVEKTGDPEDVHGECRAKLRARRGPREEATGAYAVVREDRRRPRTKYGEVNWNGTRRIGVLARSSYTLRSC